MSSRFDEMRVFSGTGNLPLTQSICERLGIKLGDATVTKFSNENIFVRLNESIREKDVFVVQSLASPLSDQIMELLILLDACKRASAGRVTAVLPYYAYGRTDKKDQPRVPITARLLADLIQVAGAQQVITLDLHAGQIQGFFSIPMDELSAMPLLVRYFADKHWDDGVVVAPDVGFAKRARNFAESLNVPLAIAEKRRIQHLQGSDMANNGLSVSTSQPQALNLIGEVQDKRCIIVDDEIASGSSVLAVADLLIERGAKEIYACCVHPVLAGDAIERLAASPVRELVTTDTLPIVGGAARWPGLTILSTATLMAEVIQRIHSGVSVNHIFQRHSPIFS